ncbi:MAG TPA: glycerophosphodiester phosphodiesterase family protein [Flavisolibacter sp.]|nr:glycerophosphodiester phosphodiesterase family protein [Flavisolibacter sp.]
MMKLTAMSLIGAFLYLCSCKTSQTMSVRHATNFDKQGHRGSRGLMPENTIPAMIKALELGVTTLEMDVVITADQQVVLSHEPFFNHEIATKPDGSSVEVAEEKRLNLYKMSYDEIRKFDVGMKPHPRFPRQQKLAVAKPLLTALVDSVEAYISSKRLPPVFYNIETKSHPLTDHLFHPAPDLFVDLLMEVIRKKNIQDRVIIQSFDIRTLQYVHQRHPSVQTALLIEDDDKRSFQEQLDRLGFIPSIYSPHYSLVTTDLLQACKQKAMRLIPWTVNDAYTIKTLRAMGVDGIISDYPDLFK